MKNNKGWTSVETMVTVVMILSMIILFFSLRSLKKELPKLQKQGLKGVIEKIWEGDSNYVHSID